MNRFEGEAWTMELGLTCIICTYIRMYYIMYILYQVYYMSYI